MMRAQAADEERPVIGEDMMRMKISGIIITQNPVLASECRAPPAVEKHGRTQRPHFGKPGRAATFIATAELNRR